MSKANGTEASQSDKHAAIDYLKRLKAGEKVERPDIHDKGMLTEIGEAEHMVSLACGDLSKLSLMYQSVSLVEIGGKPRWPLFREVMAEGESIPAGVLFTAIETKPVHWLWKRRLAFGKLTALDGDPGMGKSTLLLDIIARYTTGRPMPEEEVALCGPGGVVLVMIEDDPNDTLRPRLERAGADLSRISYLGEIPAGEIEGIPYSRPFNLQTDIPLLIREVRRMSAGLVIFDPLAGLVGKASPNDSKDMYGVLNPLAAVSRVMETAVVFTRHFTKFESENSLYRGAGSMAVIGRARLGLIVTTDPDNEEVRVLANNKSNAARLAPALSYQVTDDESAGDERAYINWLGENPHSNKELFGRGRGERQGANRLEIFKIMEARNNWMSIEEVWKILAERDEEIEYENVKKTMQRMEKSGQIKKGGARGKYGVPSVPLVPWTDELALEASP